MTPRVLMTTDGVARRVPWYPTSREKRARCGAPDLLLTVQKAGQSSRARLLARRNDGPLMGLRPVFFDPCTPVRTWGTRPAGEGWRVSRKPRARASWLVHLS